MGSEAALPSSLVSIKNNRYTQPANRGRYCARWTLKGIDLRTPTAGDPNLNRFRRVNCNCWECSYCGPIKAKRYKAAIRHWAEAHSLDKFLTLTLDPKKLPPGVDPYKYLRNVFAKFRVYLLRKYKHIGHKVAYIAVLELHLGGGVNHGKPHLHILLDTYIDQAWISEAWAALGGGHRVDIRYVSVRNVSRYLSKYLNKQMLLSIPKRTRRVTCSRSITLFPKYAGPKHYLWHMRKLAIQNFVEIYSSPDWPEQDLFQVVEIQFDPEGYLEGFAVPVSA